jgi:hypothetical protein
MDEAEGNDNEVEQNTDDAVIPTSDVVPCELVISYDKNNPSMEVGTVYIWMSSGWQCGNMPSIKSSI